ncbi:MAG: hypothetical protein AAF449_01055 [Myxococcota bacterium]
MNVRTSRSEAQRRLKANHPHQAFAEDYQPTPSGVFDDIMCGLDLDPSEHTFVDLGAGKGRILFLAAAYPFRNIVGVELIPSLAAACRDNIESFAAPWARCSSLQCVTEDAATYRPPDVPLVLYLYNPFQAPVVRRVLSNLRDSHRRQPRTVWLIYYMPVHRHHIDHDELWSVVDEHRDWVVYRTYGPRAV